MTPQPPRKRLHDIVLTVTLRAPWLVHGNDPGRLGLDAVQLRAPDGRRRLLPGTLLAGRIRDAWHVLNTDFGVANVPCGNAWFGTPSQADETEVKTSESQAHTPRRQPQRARIFTCDLVECADTPSGLLTHTRIQINAGNGAASDGMLLAVEQRDVPGSTISFNGNWRAWLADGEAAALQPQLLNALLWQTQLGAWRSIGFGELLAAGTSVFIAPATPRMVANTGAEASVQAPTLVPVESAAEVAALQAFVHAKPAPGQARGIRLRFDQPLAIANQLINGNLFRSQDFLPGAALKGALAHAWDQSQPGARKPPWFDALRFTHAQPSSGRQRPGPLPCSLVAGLEEDQPDARKLIWDVALSSGAARDLIDAHGRAVSFSPDWKTGLVRQAEVRQQRAAVARHLRVRTAIESGQAKDSSLFAYDFVMSPHLGPADGSDTPTETHWAATLDLPQEFDKPENWAQIAALLASAPLGPLGKTNAFASVELVPSLAPVWPVDTGAASKGAEVRVMLASPALLFPSSAVANNTSVAPIDLKAIYAQAFDAIAAATPPEPDAAAAPGAPMQLQRFYARQRMAGGDYLADRFRRAGQASTYLPYVLTEAGSVFVFTVLDPARAQAVLSHWQQHGLPLSQAVKDEHGGDWKTNPWLPQNGYGEVAVNSNTGFAASLQAAKEQAQIRTQLEAELSNQQQPLQGT